ncbi:MAG: U32 family peptidase [Candidatus Diapherotrites archaeon]|jgi:U32 family peptidase|uniref:U32 family peptidase n=1 Tax=Candidatus Iainarchaeum sp. TaxID=3101447 RepID=A0A8T5GET0_9ARCH|nr:U32 family peptidase [Candidatus Diapherotrites archaeon]MBT7241581.1 U32 family peptidase [Candidatus Diapherotrites archaeon]
MKRVELLVGVGSFSSAIAATKSGVNAVYFGIKGFNMRDLGTNFKKSEMKKLMEYLHENKVKGYLALNTVVFDDELTKIDSILAKAKEAKVDAVIVSDLGVLSLVKKHKLEPHLSTQGSVANVGALMMYKKLGVERIVLARELSLVQIKKLVSKAKKIGVEIEIFVHGAMCISVSGRCYLSHELFGRSANRGECLQPCRRAFFLDGDKPNYKEKDLLIQGDTIISPRDMKTIEFLDEVIKSGVVSLKIEGRTKPSDYVATVTKVYREGIDAVNEKTFSKAKIKKWNKELSKVYNRKFSKGFFQSIPSGKDLTNIQGSNQTTKRVQVGEVKKFYAKINVAEIKLFDSIKVGDDLIIEGVTTFLKLPLTSMQSNHKDLKVAEKGELVGIKTNERVRLNDVVFKVVKRGKK